MKHEENNQIKLEFKNWLKRATEEFKKAVTLSKKMIQAGQTNVELKDTLSELGLYIYKNKNQSLNYDDQEMKKYIRRIENLENIMHRHEEDIQETKNLNKIKQKVVSDTI